VEEEEGRRVESEWREWGSEWRWLEIRTFWREAMRVWNRDCQLKTPRVKGEEERKKDSKDVEV